MSANVVRITTHPLKIGMTDPLATSLNTYEALNSVIVRIEAADGTAGYGEARECVHITGETQPGVIAAIENFLSPAIAGLDTFDLTEAHRRMDAAIAGNSAAKSAIDIALHDLAGKQSGLPISRLLGGGPRGPVASSKAVSVASSERMVAQAQKFADAGFGTLKIKTGVDAAAEIEAIRFIREAVGHEVALKLDANQGWLLHDATRFLKAVERFDILMVEQPLPAWDLAGAAQLRRRTAIPVMLDEGVHTPRDALRAVDMAAADHINIKLLKTGGLKPATDIAAICAAAGITCQIGTLDTSIGSAAAVHLVHACPVIAHAEINGPTRIAFDIATGFRVHDGYAILDDGPGLGLTVDDAALAGANP